MTCTRNTLEVFQTLLSQILLKNSINVFCPGLEKLTMKSENICKHVIPKKVFHNIMSTQPQQRFHQTEIVRSMHCSLLASSQTSCSSCASYCKKIIYEHNRKDYRLNQPAKIKCPNQIHITGKANHSTTSFRMQAT